MINRSVVYVAAIALCAHAGMAQAKPQAAPPPPSPRAVVFPDTLGAAFSIADSVSGHATAADFDFLVGIWEFTFQQRRPDGTFNAGWAGHWFAEKKPIPNGFLEDHFRGDDSTRPAGAGTWTYRVFNPQRRMWEMEGVSAESGDWAPGLCWSDGENRYAVQRYGKVIVRIRYSAITDNSFLWRADMSADGGKTWMFDYWTMRAKRIAR